MKKFIAVGASGSLARFVIESVKKHEDVELTLFVRNKRRLQAASASNCVVIEGERCDGFHLS